MIQLNLEQYMKKFFLAIALLTSSVHAEPNWNKISTKPNTDGSMNEILLLVDNMSCNGINYVKFANLLNDKTKKHYSFIQAVSFNIYRSKYDSIVVAQPGPTTDFVDAETKEVLSKGIVESGRKEIVFPKTILGDIFSMACEKELAEASTTKKSDI
jgi:ribosomal protein L11